MIKIEIGAQYIVVIDAKLRRTIINHSRSEY